MSGIISNGIQRTLIINNADINNLKPEATWTRKRLKDVKGEEKILVTPFLLSLQVCVCARAMNYFKYFLLTVVYDFPTDRRYLNMCPAQESYSISVHFLAVKFQKKET